MRTARIKLAAFAPVALGALCLALAACGDSGGSAAGGAGEQPDDRAIGATDAPVTIIEYASITCSHCKRWHDDVWPQVKAEMIDTGLVRFIFRELPTAPQDVSVAGFLIARCAPEARYFNVLDTLFARQDRLFTNGREELVAVARGAGLSEEDFNACIRDEDAIAAMNARIQEGNRRYQVSSTPTFIINGKSFVGEQPIEVFREQVAQATGRPMPAPEAEDAAATPTTEGPAQ